MQGWLHRGGSVLGAMAFCFAIVGCAAQHGDSLRLSEELGHARADAAWEKAHAAELESRIARLEQRSAVTLSVQRTEDRELWSRLDRMISLNERLLAERAAPRPSAGSAVPPQAGAMVPTASSAVSTASRATPTLSQEQELRSLVERMRGRPGSPHGGLTREQEDALRVLLRPERTLDSENPWPPAFY
jgi:hypothetical protein